MTIGKEKEDSEEIVDVRTKWLIRLSAFLLFVSLVLAVVACGTTMWTETGDRLAEDHQVVSAVLMVIATLLVALALLSLILDSCGACNKCTLVAIETGVTTNAGAVILFLASIITYGLEAEETVGWSWYLALGATISATIVLCMLIYESWHRSLYFYPTQPRTLHRSSVMYPGYNSNGWGHPKAYHPGYVKKEMIQHEIENGRSTENGLWGKPTNGPNSQPLPDYQGGYDLDSWLAWNQNGPQDGRGSRPFPAPGPRAYSSPPYWNPGPGYSNVWSTSNRDYRYDGRPMHTSRVSRRSDLDPKALPRWEKKGAWDPSEVFKFDKNYT